MVRDVRRHLLTLALAALIVVSPASAAGTLTETTTAAPTLSATLNGTNLQPTYTLPITVADTRTGANANGWNLTITSTQFKTSGGTTLPTSASSVTSFASACVIIGCILPTNSVAYPVAVPAAAVAPTAVKFVNAANGTGTGTITVTPTVQVAVPANSFTGSYSSTITLAVVAGP
jgi:WxL domain surface cell wall-binding